MTPSLIVGLGLLVLGGVLAAHPATFRAGLGVQAAGAAGVGVAGFWALGAGDVSATVSRAPPRRASASTG